MGGVLMGQIKRIAASLFDMAFASVEPMPVCAIYDDEAATLPPVAKRVDILERPAPPKQTKKTQNDVVLGVLKSRGSITSMDAYELGITRLSARIWDLRHAGHTITDERVTQDSAKWGKVTFCRYRLVRCG